MAIDNRRGRQLLIGAAMCTVFAACMLPWWIRNARVSGHFVATTLEFGASLYDGLSPDADGSSNMDFVPRFEAEEHALDGIAAGQDPFEYRLDRRLASASFEWARTHLLRVLELAAIKIERIWNVWPNEPSLQLLAVATDRAVDVHAAGLPGGGGNLALLVVGLALCVGLAAGGLFHPVARHFHWLDALSRTGHAGTHGAGRRSHRWSPRFARDLGGRADRFDGLSLESDGESRRQNKARPRTAHSNALAD